VLASEIDLVLVQIAQGQYDLATTYVEEKFLAFKHVPHKQPRKAYETLRLYLWLAQDDRESAIRWINEYKLEVEDEQNTLYITERLNVAHVYLLQERFTEAHSLLAQALQASRHNQHVAFIIEVLCLQALLSQAQHDIPRALATLTEALTLGEPEGFVRTIIHYGKPMGILLTQLLNSQRYATPTKPSVSQKYITQLLFALNFSVPEVTPLSPSQTLSSRESEVLHLIAAGFADKEIAAHLVISEGTVKTHIKRIFSKLDAKSRTQAVAYAREMHLL
jgi:LuxR family maltose regulon positive regulatory protein